MRIFVKKLPIQALSFYRKANLVLAFLILIIVSITLVSYFGEDEQSSHWSRIDWLGVAA